MGSEFDVRFKLGLSEWEFVKFVWGYCGIFSCVWVCFGGGRWGVIGIGGFWRFDGV